MCVFIFPPAVNTCSNRRLAPLITTFYNHEMVSDSKLDEVITIQST